MLYIGRFNMFGDKYYAVKQYFDLSRNKHIYRWYGKWDHETDETLNVSKFKRITPDYADDLDRKLAALHTPIFAVGEIAGLANTIHYDLLPTIEYYLRAMYPCVRDVAPSPLDRFSNFDVTNIEQFIDYDTSYHHTDCYRGVYYNGKEIIIYVNTLFWCNVGGTIDHLSGVYKRIVAERLGIEFFCQK